MSFYVGREEVQIEFIRLIKTWGKGYIEGEYEVTGEEEIIHSGLKLDEESPDYMNMRMPSPEECKEGFKKNKEDQKKFFEGEGRELVKRRLIIAGGIEKIEILGYKINSTYTTIQVKRIEKRN